MAVPPLPAGHALQEYRIEKLLGVGGFGLTYLAIDTNLNLRVALKEYLPADIAVRNTDQSVAPNSATTAEDFMWGKRRFLDESRTLAEFRHPNIVRVLRFFEDKGSAYMVMEYVEGDALPDWIKTRRPLSEDQVLGLAGPILEGLQVIHNAGYMHRDIKPGNIYVRYDGSPVLLDFGSARQKSNDMTAIVTPGYAPFEQYHAQGRQGPWSDLYAFAGVLYWIVTGERPAEAAARVREDKMPRAVNRADNGRYRHEFLAAIDWALAPHEDDRPKSVHEWRPALLGSIMAPQKAKKAAPPPPPAPAPEPAQFDSGLLGELEHELAQHVGPIAPVMVRKAAQKAHDPAELIQLLAADITHQGMRVKFERRFADASRPVTRSQPATGAAAARPDTTSKVRVSPEALRRAEAELSQYLGPVAAVVVKRASLKARDVSELYLLLADEIEDPAEKKAFIRRAFSVSGKP